MKNDVVFTNIGENWQAYFDQEFEHLKKQFPEKFIGLNLDGNNFNQIDFSKFHITNLANTTNNSGGFSFNRCIFKNLKAEKKIINNIRFVDCIFLEGTELIFKDLQQNSPHPNAIHIDFSESNEENLNRNNQEIKLEISSDYNVLINLKKINLIDSLLSCLSTKIISSKAKISNSTFEGLIILENSNIEFDKKIVAKEKTIKEKSYNEFILVQNSSIIIRKSNKKSLIKNFNLSKGAKALELSNCEIHKAVIIGEITDKAIFNNVTFINPPEIGDIKFKNCNVEFSDVKFEDTSSPQAIAGFRALNKACRDANYHHGEILFHGLELETRFNMLVERSYFFKSYILISYLFKSFLFLKGFFSKNIKPVNSNNEVEKKNNLPNGDNNIKVIQQDTSKIYKKNYIKVINCIKNFLSIFLRKILSFSKKIFQLIANFINHFSYYFINHFSYFLISFFFISKDGIERFLLSFHKLFSDFGRSLLLPLFWLVVFAIVVWKLSFTQINSSNNITENLIDKECEIAKINVNELPKINKKIVFKNAIGPLQLALPKDFISVCESKFYNKNSNSIIYFLNFIHALISYAIWFVWFFMIRARFKL
jgi:hypothetical protein